MSKKEGKWFLLSLYLACDVRKRVKLFKEFLTSLARWLTLPPLDSEPPIDCECDIDIRFSERWFPKLREGGWDDGEEVRKHPTNPNPPNLL